MSNESTITISTKNLYVITALEYGETGTRAPKHPLVTLEYIDGKNSKVMYIQNRYVLFSLLKRCDPSLKYEEFMQTIYDIPIGFEDKPSFKDMINGYLGLDVVFEAVTTFNGSYFFISHISDDNTYSEYFHTTFDFIHANFLPDYEKNVGCKVKVQGSSYPQMSFVKQEGKIGSSEPIRIIKILSRKGKTTITGAVSFVTSGLRYTACATIQPIDPIVIPNWVHTIEASHMNSTLSSVDERLDEYINNVTLKDSQIVLMTGSERLNDFNDKNKLEREYYFESLRVGKIV